MEAKNNQALKKLRIRLLLFIIVLLMVLFWFL